MKHASPHAARRHPLTPLSPLAALLLAAGGCFSLAATAAPAGSDARPWVSGNRTVPIFTAAQTVKEVVNVQTGYDREGDGKPDFIRVEITRPVTPAGTRVPLIIHASPYFFQSRRSAWETDYFVPRGYAVATVALPGTDFSTGCADVGGNYEVLGTKAVIDWANGRATGLYTDGRVADATQWTDGKTGMIGVSWDGTIANSVAATGVEGLKTIVPVAAISSWYDYTRGHGTPFYADHVTFLNDFVSNYYSQVCRDMTPVLQADSDDPTGNYNPWWSVRDYRPSASKLKASVFVVHGLNDENVKTRQFGEWWDELSKLAVPRRLFLHQGEHIEPYYSFGSTYTTPLQQWFDHYLQGLDNGAPNEPQAIIQREDGSWSTDATWPPEGIKNRKLRLSSAPGRMAGALATQDLAGSAASRYQGITQATAYSDDSIVANPTQLRTDRLVFLSNPLAAPLREAGTATVSLRVKVDRPAAGLQARVVDYAANGSAYIVTRTIADLGHYQSLKVRKDLVPGEWYTLTWELNTDDRIFATGHRMGLVITAEHPNPLYTYQPVTATVDTQQSWISLPLSGKPASLASLAAPGALNDIRTTQVGPRGPARNVQDFVREFFEGTR